MTSGLQWPHGEKQQEYYLTVHPIACATAGKSALFPTDWNKQSRNCSFLPQGGILSLLLVEILDFIILEYCFLTAIVPSRGF